MRPSRKASRKAAALSQTQPVPFYETRETDADDPTGFCFTSCISFLVRYLCMTRVILT